MQLIQIDTLVGLFDATIGEMLITVSQIKLLALTKTRTKTNMITELKRAAELTARINEGRRNQMKTNCAFKIRRNSGRIFLLQTKHGCDAQVGDRLIITDTTAPLPCSRSCFPETGYPPIPLGKPLFILLPDCTYPGSVGIVAITQL